MIPRFAPLWLRSLFFGVLLLALAAGVGAQGIDLDEITANEEFRWGVQALHDGKINEAITSLSRSLSFDSERSHTRYWLGRAYYYGGFEQSALRSGVGLPREAGGHRYSRSGSNAWS